MRYTAIAETDVGIRKSTNQDSVLIRHATFDGGEVLMAIVCDGMGGLAKGELASATVIRAFADWFEKELPLQLEKPDLNVIGAKWALMLKNLNGRIGEYGKSIHVDLGTTFTGALFLNGSYVAVHVGDTRLYHLSNALTQLTEDQTFIAREIRKGTMTPEQAKTDKRRNLLLQCVGASPRVEPQVLTGTVESGAYMICSDGFRHVISEQEILGALSPARLTDADAMHANVRYLIELVKSRGERDNISALLIKAE